MSEDLESVMNCLRYHRLSLRIWEDVISVKEIRCRADVHSIFTNVGPARLYSNNPKQRLNYYEILGVPTSASQSQIKSAYYRQSMKYHPDVTKVIDSGEKFASITEAYQVLGTYESRKKYDRMTLVLEKRSRPHIPRRSYDGPSFSADQQFDQFYRSYYAMALKRSQHKQSTTNNKDEQIDDHLKAEIREYRSNFLSLPVLMVILSVILMQST